MSKDERIKEILLLAKKLGWTEPSPKMHLADVEKCMFALIDDFELRRMQKWTREKTEETKYCKECGQTKPVILQPIFGNGKNKHKHRFDKEAISDSISKDCKIGLKVCLDCGYTEVREIKK